MIIFYDSHCTDSLLNLSFRTEFSLSFLLTASLSPALGFFPAFSHCHPSALLFFTERLYLEICPFSRIYLSIHTEEVLKTTEAFQVAKQHLCQY